MRLSSGLGNETRRGGAGGQWIGHRGSIREMERDRHRSFAFVVSLYIVTALSLTGSYAKKKGDDSLIYFTACVVAVKKL